MCYAKSCAQCDKRQCGTGLCCGCVCLVCDGVVARCIVTQNACLSTLFLPFVCGNHLYFVLISCCCDYSSSPSCLLYGWLTHKHHYSSCSQCSHGSCAHAPHMRMPSPVRVQLLHRTGSDTPCYVGMCEAHVVGWLGGPPLCQLWHANSTRQRPVWCGAHGA
jgi:hypothetical protein